MSCPAPAPCGRLFALAVLAGTTAVTGGLAAALPAVAAPVAIEGHLSDVPAGTPNTGGEFSLTPMMLSNGDTAYGINEDQPLAPMGETVLDDEAYAVAAPFDDPDGGAQNVVGEKVGDHGVYWTPENAALAGYILSVFGATDDADEALAVHWAVRSLSTAADPFLPELLGLDKTHLERAEFLIQDARHNVPSVTPKSSYKISVSSAADGRPDGLLVRMPEAYRTTTITLSGPVTFADGTTTRTFTGGDQDKLLELAVPAGVTEGEFSAGLEAVMPSTELTVLADEQYRDLLIAGQDRTVRWSASAGFAIDASTEPAPPTADPSVPPLDSDKADDPDDDDAAPGAAIDVDSPVHPAAGKTRTVAAPGEDGNGYGSGGGDLLVVDVPDTHTTAVVEAFVLFEERTETQTHIVTGTTVTAGATGAVGSAAYAASVTADTGMGAAQTPRGRGAIGPSVLGAVAVSAGLGAWMLHRRRPAAPTD